LKCVKTIKTSLHSLLRMKTKHYIKVDWDGDRWPNFSAKELSCRHCGQYYHDPEFLDKLQWVRTKIEKPLHINSAHRCFRHNLAVGGVPLSQHRKLAVDISLRNHNKEELNFMCKSAGFTGFGYYQTFLHIDTGRRRHWFGGDKSLEFWSND